MTSIISEDDEESTDNSLDPMNSLDIGSMLLEASGVYRHTRLRQKITIPFDCSSLQAQTSQTSSQVYQLTSSDANFTIASNATLVQVKSDNAYVMDREDLITQMMAQKKDSDEQIEQLEKMVEQLLLASQPQPSSSKGKKLIGESSPEEDQEHQDDADFEHARLEMKIPSKPSKEEKALEGIQQQLNVLFQRIELKKLKSSDLIPSSGTWLPTDEIQAIHITYV